jgi:hypothetical protein
MILLYHSAFLLILAGGVLVSLFNPSEKIRTNVKFYAEVLQALAIIGAGGWAAFTYHHQTQDENQRALAQAQAVGRELRRPYYEKQLNLYLEASKVVSDLATLVEGDERKKAEQRFWELYWGELAFVESSVIEGMMRSYCDKLFDASKCDHQLSPNPRLGDALNFSHQARDEIRGQWRVTNP